MWSHFLSIIVYVETFPRCYKNFGLVILTNICRKFKYLFQLFFTYYDKVKVTVEKYKIFFIQIHNSNTEKIAISFTKIITKS